MDRLTNDNPQGNFETMLNYVFGKDGYAYIRSDGESDEPVLLTEWARKQCLERHCDVAPDGTPDDVDQSICDCAFYRPECPIFLAYTFACQAVHMRDRCKAYEDAILFPDLPRAAKLVKADDKGLCVVLNEPRKPLILDDDHEGARCPYCGIDLMGIPYGDRILLQCPECGEYVDGTKAITRAEAEAALADK